MDNNPTPGGRRPHPLERRPLPPAPPDPSTPARPRIRVELPTVTPLVTYALIAINVAVFLLRALSPEIDEDIYLWGANIPSLVVSGEYYRLLTSMFLHASIYGFRGDFAFSNSIHILFNMFVLYGVGRQIEPVFGHARFALIYLLGGLMGSVFSAVFREGGGGSVGASGAVFAVIGAELIYLYRHRELLGAAAQAQMRSLLVWGFLNLALGALGSTFGSGMRIDNWGHLGGLAGGLALAWLIAPIFQPRPSPREPTALIAEDANPLSRRVWVLFAYALVLIAILAFASAR